MKKISTMQAFSKEILQQQKLTIGVDLGDRCVVAGTFCMLIHFSVWNIAKLGSCEVRRTALLKNVREGTRISQERPHFLFAKDCFR
jgi:hypothetical protein